jgi:DNA-binding NarL/FixJ family response regulator
MDNVSMLIRVLLADDYAIVRAGLRNALTNIPNLEIVGEADDGHTLMNMLAQLTPDLLVVDVSMPNFDPVPALQQIKTQYPALRILIVSAYADEVYLTGLLSAGVDGYHLKDQPLADLQLAVGQVLKGERWISGPLVDRLVHRQPSATNHSSLPLLTRRQRELLRLLTQGYDNRTIAQTMSLSVKTVENHLTTLYRALGVDRRLAATTLANQHPELLAHSGAATDPEPKLGPAGALSVLVVDDNALYRQQLTRIIGKKYPGVLIYEAEDTIETLRLAERVHPLLALMDVVLRDEDGIQCARRLKAISPATRVVLISAYPDREFRRLGLSAGAVAFLDKKDLDSATVHQVVEDAIGSFVN